VIGPKIGHRFDAVVVSLCRFIFRSTTLSPNTITITGTLFGFLSAFLIFFEHPVLGAIALLIAGFLDILDGALARTQGQVTSFGGFLDSVLDRYTDLLVMGAIMLVYVRHNEPRLALAAFIAAVGTALIPYARARAEAASIPCKTGLLERPERIVLVLIGLFIPFLLDYIVIILAVLTHVTVIQRMVHVWKEAKKLHRKP
jgi:CDP-diacylglycerol---glycerol-3-phosphate 3-phosphatidyltransferase